MALVMVQGHAFESLVSPEARADALYQLQLVIHGSTAPGFLFASGFVAGLPRSPLSVRASLRRARRLLFVFGVGYALHLPYLSLWKTLRSTLGEQAALFACDALQVIAATQLLVLLLQWIFGLRWQSVAGALTVAVVAVGPFVHASDLATRVHPAVAAYIDDASGSHFPIFPFSAFVLAGTVAGAALGRQDPQTRRRRGLSWGVGLTLAGAVVSLALAGRVDFWHISPGYVLLRLGGLVMILLLVERLADAGLPGIPALALLGHETLLVFCLHLYWLYGGAFGAAPLADFSGVLGFGSAFGVLLAMLPALLLAAFCWHAFKSRFPQGATDVLAFLTTAFVAEFLTRPW
jgi:hypothetical protein